jgi:hypothetical protein
VCLKTHRLKIAFFISHAPLVASVAAGRMRYALLPAPGLCRHLHIAADRAMAIGFGRWACRLMAVTSDAAVGVRAVVD